MIPVSALRFTPSSFNPSFVPPPKRERFAMTPLGALQALGASCTRAEILTYTALELHADKDTGFCNPGRETLAAITGLPENRVTKATTSLEKKGFIRKEQPDPFHVHYFLLPPPAVEPVEPRARFRPPLKQSPVPPAEPTPCRLRHELVPPAAPLTNQCTDQKPERVAEPEPAPPEPAAPAQAPLSVPLRNTKTTVPDIILDVWLEQAAIQRPDLTPEQIKTSAGVFVDHHRAKGSLMVDWSAAFRVWIARERAPKATVQRPQAPQTPPRYSPLTGPKAPVPAAVQAALEQSEQRRLELLRKAGIDPATGLKIGVEPIAPPLAGLPPLPDGSPLPSGEKESPEAYRERIEQHRRFQLERLARLMEQKGAGK